MKLTPEFIEGMVDETTRLASQLEVRIDELSAHEQEALASYRLQRHNWSLRLEEQTLSTKEARLQELRDTPFFVGGHLTYMVKDDYTTIA